MVKIQLGEFWFFDFKRGKIAKFWKIQIFQLNGAVNYSLMKKFNVRGQDLSNKKTISSILEFSILSGKIAKFGKKIRIFEFNSALNHSMVKKFLMKRLNLNNKKIHLAILQFLNLTGKIAKFRKIQVFERNLTLNYSAIKKKWTWVNNIWRLINHFRFKKRDNLYILKNLDFQT